jgi:hypothetical protein
MEVEMTDYTPGKYTVTFSVAVNGRVQEWQFGLSEHDYRRFVAGERQMVTIELKSSRTTEEVRE